MGATEEAATTEELVTIDELAHQTGMTARNIRAHQSRGLLPPPEVRARTGYYGAEHAARIHLIQEMQNQGFNLTAIKRLIEIGAGSGRAALELERAILAPFGDETPEVITESELAEVFGTEGLDRKLVAKGEKMGAIVALGEGKWEVPSPTLLRAAGQLVELGIPLNHALAVGDSIHKHTSSIAKDFVRLFIQDVMEPLREGGLSEEELARAKSAIEKLRPLASEAVLASFAQVMTETVERQVVKELG